VPASHGPLLLSVAPLQENPPGGRRILRGSRRFGDLRRGIAVVPGRKAAWPGTHASHKRRGRRESRHSAFGSVADYEVTAQEGLDLVVRHETEVECRSARVQGARRTQRDGGWAMEELRDSEFLIFLRALVPWCLGALVFRTASPRCCGLEARGPTPTDRRGPGPEARAARGTRLPQTARFALRIADKEPRNAKNEPDLDPRSPSFSSLFPPHRRWPRKP